MNLPKAALPGTILRHPPDLVARTTFRCNFVQEVTMAVIRPFRGVRYNLEKIGDLSRVITQPYDRIHEPEQ
ncbi:MAG: hypothetical protein RMK65_00200, partial [Anaerolineae bacterium]|nr:hypothetical protein [Anaerolineae bacterium]